ncbi:MAG: hypothetical protein EBT76_05215 [Microbacteriaceae bacterium]|nr:hypothetical protein [Microbacteriaceae bacterium]
MNSDAITLTKFSGLLRSGIAMPKAIEIIGGIPTNNPGLQYLLEVAIQSGAGVAAEIDVVADLCYQRDSSLERIKVAYAGPKSSSRLVIWLPVLTMLIAQLSGFELLGAILAAKIVSSKLIARATPTENHSGYFLMAVALASGGGANLNKAQMLAFESHTKILGEEPSKSELLAMAEIANLVETTGARVCDLLKSQARNMQRENLTANELRIEQLSIRLMLPLGLAVLPAFVCLAVIPLMASMFGPK